MPQSIIDKWSSATAALPELRCRFQLLAGANHKVDDEAAQMALVVKVCDLLRSLGTSCGRSSTAMPQGSREGRRPPPPLPKTQGIPAWQLADTDVQSSAVAPNDPRSAVSNATESAASSTAQPTNHASVVPPRPPPFDALVELIASGRTDEIEGIRDIPLKINEEAPSESRMPAQKKPWEKDAE